MESSSESEENDEFEWSDEEELPAGHASLPSGQVSAYNLDLPSSSNQWASTREAVSGPSREIGEVGSSRPKLVSHFLGMGFSEDMVIKAIKANGEEDTEAILETLLTYSAVEKCSPIREKSTAELCSSTSEREILDDDISDIDDFSDEEGATNFSEKEKKLLTLVEMGFLADEASLAIDRCGPDASVLELADSIQAAQMAEEFDDGRLEGSPLLSSDEDETKQRYAYYAPRDKKRRWAEEEWRQNKKGHSQIRTGGLKRILVDRAKSHIPKPMTGFNLPRDTQHNLQHRNLPEPAIGPPYFYYENVALAPKGVWETISRFLYDIEPEFVDSKHFCATARKRGYIHNLPIHNRFQVTPLPPRTIHEALPLTRKWWPSWDSRTQLNCLQTCTASAKLTERIRSLVVHLDDPPPPDVQGYILFECRKWNLVWVGLHKVAPLEPDEIEMLLGFPRDHTRGGGISRTERYKSLGNSFQVDTVAYHLSVLKEMYPNGIKLLSLFSGIGGAEVALHRLEIPLKVVVSVEISEINRNIVRSWWEQTDQKGTLIDLEDVQQLNGDRLEKLINQFGGFDLIIGGSPCNNLTGSNRVTRDGLEGKDSSLFYDYFRILDHVKCIMGRNL